MEQSIYKTAKKEYTPTKCGIKIWGKKFKGGGDSDYEWSRSSTVKLLLVPGPH